MPVMRGRGPSLEPHSQQLPNRDHQREVCDPLGVSLPSSSVQLCTACRRVTSNRYGKRARRNRKAGFDCTATVRRSLLAAHLSDADRSEWLIAQGVF